MMNASTPPPDGPAAAQTGRALYAAQRKQAIITQLRAAGRVDAADIAAQLGVTNETVRKDLISLEQQGLLRRVHGGAVPVEQLSFEPAVSTRTYYTEEKTRIAKAALAHLPASGAVLLDAGSTTARLAELFPSDRELTVVTLGGRVRPLTLAEVDDWAARALAEINVDVAFLGANAISVERGLTTPDPAEAAVKRLMLTSARRRILLADHSKVGAISLCKHADISDIDLLITDTGLPVAELRALQAAGLQVEQT
jgi:DeoR family fructose operon transcriptional repressor